jgi:hypothetical protein
MNYCVAVCTRESILHRVINVTPSVESYLRRVDCWPKILFLSVIDAHRDAD